jgi:hypothetical protein
MNRECNVTKRLLTRNGLYYCAVVLSAKGRIKPSWFTSPVIPENFYALEFGLQGEP